jgi:hypothetical protein
MVKRWITYGAATLVLAACGQEATDPFESVPDAADIANAVSFEAGKPFRIRAGTIARVGDDGLLIGFRGVSEDSRCPVDVVCVWEGDASARIMATVGRAEWTGFDLHTRLDPREARFNDWKIRLIGVEPYPRSDRRIDPGDYVATLEVSR